MKDTVEYTRLHSYFEGRVLIDELKCFNDSRGNLIEIWRADDGVYSSDYVEKKESLNQKVIKDLGNNFPNMCYFSNTKPLIMRGPHLHKDQTDFFISTDSKMLYIFVYEGKPVYFKTEKNKTYRLKVEPGVIHSYRNLDLNENSSTLNFPSSLFKGVDKKDEIDEIRYEHTIKGNKNVVIFGANGRLGKALTKTLIDKMGVHEYNIIPISENIDNGGEGIRKIKFIVDFLINNPDRNEEDIVINCIAKTNVQKDTSDQCHFSNYLLPKFLTEYCVENSVNILNFSTDYVYQTGDVSEYTKSKKKFEDWVEYYCTSNTFTNPILSNKIKKHMKIIRLSNLFSLERTDIHNALNKLHMAFIKDTVKIPKRLQIMPTSVESVSKWMCDNYIHHLDSHENFINLSGRPYEIEQIFEEFFKVLPKYTYVNNPSPLNHPNLFLNRSCYRQVNCDDDIRKKIDQIRNS